MNKIVVVDFSGTLIKPDVAEKANLLRYEILGIPKPSDESHKKQHGNKGHYDVIKQFISEQYGVTDNMQIKFVQNYGDEVTLSGKDVKTVIMTDLFRNAMYLVAIKEGNNIFPKGMIETLLTIQKRGYKLAIVSGIRTDIISGMLAISECPLNFDYIFGQDPVLSRDSNVQLNQELSKKGKIEYVIGDKLDDFKPAKSFQAKSIWVDWGHPTGGEREYADFSVHDPKDLEKIIK
ncbi:HAD family hydrolase [Candidatus Woesearchaeota archaeon]|nr:HAD family hydrolase [Candidatus Woesearchaeota archaeon]